MPSPITWQAMQAIAAELTVIRIATGYFTDLGASTGLEPAQAEADDAPRVVLGMDRLTVRELASGLREAAFTAIVECLVPASHLDAQQRAHEALADVMRVFPVSPRDLVLTPSTTVAQVAADTGQVLPRPDGVGLVVAQARLNVTIREVVA